MPGYLLPSVRGTPGFHCGLWVQRSAGNPRRQARLVTQPAGSVSSRRERLCQRWSRRPLPPRADPARSRSRRPQSVPTARWPVPAPSRVDRWASRRPPGASLGPSSLAAPTRVSALPNPETLRRAEKGSSLRLRRCCGESTSLFRVEARGPWAWPPRPWAWPSRPRGRGHPGSHLLRCLSATVKSHIQ